MKKKTKAQEYRGKKVTLKDFRVVRVDRLMKGNLARVTDMTDGRPGDRMTISVKDIVGLHRIGSAVVVKAPAPTMTTLQSLGTVAQLESRLLKLRAEISIVEAKLAVAKNKTMDAATKETFARLLVNIEDLAS